MKKQSATIGNVQKWRLQRRVIATRKFCHKKDCLHKSDLLRMMFYIGYTANLDNWKWYNMAYEMIAEGLY